MKIKGEARLCCQYYVVSNDVPALLTLLQFLKPGLDNVGVVLPMVDKPKAECLDALLARIQL